MDSCLVFPLKLSPTLSNQPPRTDSRANLPPKPSQSSATSPVTPTAPAPWRTKARPPSPPQRHSQGDPLTRTILQQPDTLDNLNIRPDEELEVVDFSEFGKFVGTEDTSMQPATENAPGTTHTSVLRIPVASDAFGNNGEAVPAAKSDGASWRRKSFDQPREQLGQPAPSEPAKRGIDGSTTTEGLGSSPDVPVSLDHSHGLNSRVNSSQGYPRSQRSPFYKEPTMSTLDDTLSRIKGAINGMQSGEPPRERPTNISADSDRHSAKQLCPTTWAKSDPPAESRWIPPALRPTTQRDPDWKPREVFEVTSCEPPRSPEPTSFVVRLPSVLRTLELLNERQMHAMKSYRCDRWDILSWNPPVAQMKRRTLSINEVLFKRPYIDPVKGPKYRISLPRSTSFSRTNSYAGGSDAPKVNLPGNGALPKFTKGFGRPNSSDTLTTWRKPAPFPVWEGRAEAESTLSTVSRSPPPQTPTTLVAETPTPKGDATTPSQRLRSPPKMPEGSGVAFYRSNSLTSDPQTVVNFTVGSELDETTDSSHREAASRSQVKAPIPVAKADDKTESRADTSIVNDLKSQPPSPDLAAPPLVQTATGGKGSDDSVSLYFQMVVCIY
jgi:serine/arginine repetitive matrix protein 2